MKRVYDPTLIMCNVRLKPELWEEVGIVARMARMTIQEFVASALEAKCAWVVGQREAERNRKSE